jgi:hypothetical protein
VEPAPVSRTVVVPATEACDVLDVLVHAVSAAAMASAAAPSTAAVRGGLLVWMRESRCGIGAVPVVSEVYAVAAWRVQAWAPACTASQGEPSGGV